MAETGLPTKWREAVPYVMWIVLVLGFGLEFSTNFIHGNWVLAFLSFCAMAGLMAVTLHWLRLRSWMTTVSSNWVVASFLSLLLVIALLPFIEQKRWPFSAWFEANSESQKETLIAWLQQAQRERDKAKQDRDRPTVSPFIYETPPPGSSRMVVWNLEPTITAGNHISAVAHIANKGKVPASKLVRKGTTLVPSVSNLAPDDVITGIITLLRNQLATEAVGDTTVYPEENNLEFNVVGQDLNDRTTEMIKLGSLHPYIITLMRYTDETVPSGKFLYSETCIYLTGSTQNLCESGHNKTYLAN